MGKGENKKKNNKSGKNGGKIEKVQMKLKSDLVSDQSYPVITSYLMTNVICDKKIPKIYLMIKFVW